MDKLAPGDVVRLKSGGTKMTVETVDEYGVYCVWFETDPKGNTTGPKRESFQPAVLEKS